MTDRVVLTAKQAVKITLLGGLAALVLEVRYIWRFHHSR